MAKIMIPLVLLASLMTTAARQCQNLTFPIDISAQNGKFNLRTPSNNVEVTNFILDLTRPKHNLSKELFIDVRHTDDHLSLYSYKV